MQPEFQLDKTGAYISQRYSRDLQKKEILIFSLYFSLVKVAHKYL